MGGLHRAAAIVPADDLEASAAFYERLGFETVSDWGDYRILSDGRGLDLHLRRQPGWPARTDANPFGLYLYVDDVDAAAARVRELILGPGKPEQKAWGCYEFAVSDPTGVLVRIGRITG